MTAPSLGIDRLTEYRLRHSVVVSILIIGFNGDRFSLPYNYPGNNLGSR